MKNLLKVADASGRHMVVLLLDERTTRKAAADVVFDVLGSDAPQELANDGTLAEGQVSDFIAIQRLIFDRDAQGLFIRDDVSFKANGKDLNPDAPLAQSFLPASKEGIDYKRCDLIVCGSGGAAAEFAAEPESSQSLDAATQTDQHGSIPELARLMFLHQIGNGALVDVTKDLPELQDILSKLEKDGLIDIDVKKAAYALSAKGKRTHQSYLEEAQNLIRRYDIFGDVDIDASGNAHFDTGLGKDLRVPVYEVEGINPYRARFLLGLNDGEWNHLEDWIDMLEKEEWYREIFAPIDRAPSVDQIGRAKLQSIIEQGKSVLRSSV